MKRFLQCLFTHIYGTNEYVDFTLEGTLVTGKHFHCLYIKSEFKLFSQPHLFLKLRFFSATFLLVFCTYTPLNQIKHTNS